MSSMGEFIPCWIAVSVSRSACMAVSYTYCFIYDSSATREEAGSSTRSAELFHTRTFSRAAWAGESSGTQRYSVTAFIHQCVHTGIVATILQLPFQHDYV